MFLMIDNYDSFTYNLVQCFASCGEEMEVVRNDSPAGMIDASRYAGIVLSPGPSRPEHSGLTLEAVGLFASLPMLGVCLGMQAMVHALGGRVDRARRVMHGKADSVQHYGGALFAGVPSPFPAVRYHSLAAVESELPPCFEVMARSSDGEVMSVRHRERFLWGVQFHPESCGSGFGVEIIRNFIGGAYAHSQGDDRICQ